MSSKIKDGKQVTTIDASQNADDPVTEVLKILNNNGFVNKPYVCLDFSSIKPTKLDENNLGNLFLNLPNQPNINYIISLPERIVHNAEVLAGEYKDSIEEYNNKPHYSIMNKKSAIMLVNQRNKC